MNFGVPYRGTPQPRSGQYFTKNELITAVREDIIGELEAINQYNAHIVSTDNELARRVWADIRDEERVHTGELITLLNQLSPDELQKLQQGQAEVEKIMRELGL